MTDAAPSQLADDIYAVTKVMNTYCWSLDTRDWDRLARCFSDDMTFEASNMGRYDDPVALLQAFQTRTIRTPVRRHMVVNPYVRVDGDTAELTSNLMNVRIRPRAPGGEFFIAGGYYRNSFRRTGDGWKMSALRWEEVFMEGNSRLDPSLPQMSYTPVMGGMTEAPWGGVLAQGKDGDRSDTQQVRDLCTGLFRALDAGQVTGAAAAFSQAAAGKVGDQTCTGGDAICAALTAGGGGWTQHDFFNEKYGANGERGVYGAYVYRIAKADGPNVHGGGILLIEAAKEAAGWLISALEYLPFWQRGTEIPTDPVRVMPDYQRITRLPWSMESTRAPLRDEDEVVALMCKYTWNYDFWDFEQVKDCFTEDVVGTFTTGITSHFIGREEMIPGIRQGHEQQPYMQHYCTNFVVDMGVDGVSAELKCYASTRRTEAGGGHVYLAGGRYDGYARKTDGVWRFVTFQYTRIHGAYDGEQPAA